jgi:hypothetical protein
MNINMFSAFIEINNCKQFYFCSVLNFIYPHESILSTQQNKHSALKEKTARSLLWECKLYDFKIFNHYYINFLYV